MHIGGGKKKLRYTFYFLWHKFYVFNFMLLLIFYIVIVTWNGTTITGPELIYQDELVSDNRDNVQTDDPLDGTLICRHETQAQVGWYFANGGTLSTNTEFHFRQRRTGTTATPSVSRLTTNQEDQPLDSIIANGLWTCRLDGDFNVAIPVGIFIRGGGNYTLTSTPCSLHTHACRGY